jgi:hypothetical protein
MSDIVHDDRLVVGLSSSDDLIGQGAACRR